MLDKTYNSAEIEDKIYQKWEDSGVLKASTKAEGEPYCVLLPPPNVTGVLHMGHAFDQTLQDLLIRYNRMNGKNVLWQVGTDHAGIATQMVVERNLAQEGLSRHDLGREKFLEKVWEWKGQSGGTITSQMRKLGDSCDWSRERFTMDEGLSKAVRKVFVQLYKEGLIYRDFRLVNWDPKLGTAISDLEVESRDTIGKMYYFRYPVVGQEGRYLTVATTRPETMFGDTAVAVNPEDERYKDLIGKKVLLPIANREIVVVGDEHADPTKGTGAVKITPGHDFNDFEVGKRHDLEMINILTAEAKLNENVPKAFRGMDCATARPLVVAEMERLGLFEKSTDNPMVIPYGDRSGVVIEPWLTYQWFVDVKKLAPAAKEAVTSGEVKFVPENWEKSYFEWLDNILPWCISRQLWWGHQIPVWYAEDGTQFCEETEEAAMTAAEKHFGKKVELTQETDVLDTWFSSGLWPFSTLGWPEETEFLDHFYPTAVLVTGFDIIFFWVIRMMLMGCHIMKKPPFKTIYMHGLVRDEFGKKMSKSKGNVVDPLEMMAKYGTDALRFTMSSMPSQGTDAPFSEKKVEGFRNFVTKIWNAARFCEMNECKLVDGFNPYDAKHQVNKWIVAKAEEATAEITASIDAYKFNEASNSAYHFTWGTFCDWYLELVKPLFGGDDEAVKAEARATAAWVLDRIITLLHPFMPFVTEELWAQTKDNRSNMLISEAWPKAKAIDASEREEIDWVIELITAIRSLRSNMNVPPSVKAKIYLKDANTDSLAIIERQQDIINKLARLDIIGGLEGDIPNGSAQDVFKEATMIMPMAGLIDVAKEKERLEKELKKLDADITMFTKKLGNPNFVAGAPEAVVAEQKEKLANAQDAKAKIEEAIARLSSIAA